MSRRKEIITLPYTPRSQQLEIHRALDTYRFAVVAAHRRFGKTTSSVNHLIRDVIRADRSKDLRTYAYFAPTFAQAKRIVWESPAGFKKHTAPIRGVKFNEAELRIDFTEQNARVFLLGVDNPEAIRGLGITGAVLDEVGQFPANAWPEIIRPTLSDTLGWALFIGTPKGTNAFKRIYDDALESDDWWANTYQASDTGIIPTHELLALQKEMSEELYAQEYLCSWSAALVGSYYGRLLDDAMRDGRVGTVRYDPKFPVSTAWDIGRRDSTAIWFTQPIGTEVRVLDYFEDSQETLPYYVDLLRQKPYRYGQHFAPHDIEVAEWLTPGSRKQVAADLGVHFMTVPAAAKKDEDIEATRLLIPRCAFDSVKCKQGLEGLRHYHQRQNRNTGEFTGQPEHDWSSHPSDAFAVLARGLSIYRGSTQTQSRPKPELRDIV